MPLEHLLDGGRVSRKSNSHLEACALLGDGLDSMTSSFRPTSIEDMCVPSADATFKARVFAPRDLLWFL